MFALENVHPVPTSTAVYPFRDMQPGQSFLITGLKTSQRVRSALYQYTRRHNAKLLAQVESGEITVADAEAAKLQFSLRAWTEDGVPQSDETPEDERTFRLWRQS